MEVIYAKLICALIVALVNIMAGIVLVPCHKWIARQSKLPYIIAFTGGTLFSVALTQTLPDAVAILSDVQTSSGFPVSYLLFGAGFLAMYMVGIGTRVAFGESVSSTARTAYLKADSGNRMHLSGPSYHQANTPTDGLVNDFAHLTSTPLDDEHALHKKKQDTDGRKSVQIQMERLHTLDSDDEEDESPDYRVPSLLPTPTKQNVIVVETGSLSGVLDSQRQRSKDAGTLRAVTAGILIETLVAGMAIGIQQRMSGVLITALAIVTHDWWEATGLSIQYLKAGRGPCSLVVVSLSIALTFVIGVIGGLMFTDVFHVSVGMEVSAGMVSFASGVFMYVAVVEMIMQQDTDDHGAFMANQDKEHHKRNIKKAVVATIAFFLVSLLSLV